MSNYVVSARKYRPLRFDEVVGQGHVSQTLKNALSNDQLAQAFLFCGPRGVGKTTCARILAKVLNCQNRGADNEPCNKCSACEAFNGGSSFNILELDAASNNSVEHIRTLIEQVRFQPQQGKYKVFIIDEVHMLSQQAFNAFLKTLEEPPPYAVFILATTEKHKIIPTILSRCQIFDFKRIQIPDMVVHLQEICKTEGITAEAEALHVIAQKADGALRDALSIFDRMVAFGGNAITYSDVIQGLNVLDYDYYFRLVDYFLVEDRNNVMLLFDEILRNGFEPDLFLNGLGEHLRNLLVAKDVKTLALLEGSDKLRERYGVQAALCPASMLLSGLQVVNDCDINYKMARNKRLHVEMALLKLLYLPRAVQRPVFAEQHPASPEKKTPVDTAPPEQIVKPTVVASPPAAPPGPRAVASAAPSNTDAGAAAAPAPTAAPTGKYAMAQLANLDSMLAEEAEQAQEEEVKEVLPLTIDRCQALWQQYTDRVERGALRASMQQIQLVLEGEETLIVKARSQVGLSTVRDEKPLIEFLRSELNRPQLVIRYAMDEDRPKVEVKKPTVLGPKDIYQQLREQNPLVDDLRKRFDLQIDED